jgi:hypothetical protein
MKKREKKTSAINGRIMKGMEIRMMQSRAFGYVRMGGQTRQIFIARSYYFFFLFHA